MKTYFLFKAIYRFQKTIIFGVFAIFLLSYCTQEPQMWKVKSTDQVAGDYVSSNPDYSEFAKLVEVTGIPVAPWSGLSIVAV